MRTRSFILLLFVLFMISCGKEVSFEQDSAQGGGPNPPGGTGNNNNNNNNQNKSIEGDWNFVGAVVHSESTTIASQGGIEIKSVSISDYTTEENTGSMKITSGEFIYDDIGYRFETSIKVKMYMDGVLFNEMSQPWDQVSPPIDYTSTYTRVNADSLTLNSGMVGSDPGSGGPQSSVAGVRITWSGDTLVLKMSQVIEPYSPPGAPGSMSGIIRSDIKLIKK